MNIEQGAHFIAEQIRTRNPFFVGKLGTSELDVIIFFTQYRQKTYAPSYPQHIKVNIARNGGLFPATDKAIDAWAVHMLTEVLPAAAGFAIWNPVVGNIEKAILNTFAPNAKQFPLRALEPYYINVLEDRWTYNLTKHAKVAVVSPFYKSIEHQWKKRDAIWGDNTIWGPVPPTIIPVKAGYSPYLSTSTGLWTTEIINGGWRAAVADVACYAVGIHAYGIGSGAANGIGAGNMVQYKAGRAGSSNRTCGAGQCSGRGPGIRCSAAGSERIITTTDYCNACSANCRYRVYAY
jgi:hypothetical protein